MMWDGNGYWGHGAGWEGWVTLMVMIVQSSRRRPG